MIRHLMLLVFLLSSVVAQSKPSLQLLLSVPLLNVEGRIDHMALDDKQQLFVAALGNDSLEVVNLKTQTTRSLKGFSEPQGVVFIPALNQVFVTNGGDGTGIFLDAATLEVVRKIEIGSDPDNVRLDAVRRQLFVGYGSALGVFDLQGQRLIDIKLAAHPEGLELEPNKDGVISRVFVNVPSAGQVAVVDLVKHSVKSWKPPAASNFPMALDTVHQRLLIATRSPPRLIVFDTATGKVVSNLETVGDADDVFISGQRIFVSGGAGEVRVLERQNADRYTEVARVSTASGARTALLETNAKRLFVAVPHRSNQAAAIQVFDVIP